MDLLVQRVHTKLNNWQHYLYDLQGNISFCLMFVLLPIYHLIIDLWLLDPGKQTSKYQKKRISRNFCSYALTNKKSRRRIVKFPTFLYWFFLCNTVDLIEARKRNVEILYDFFNTKLIIQLTSRIVSYSWVSVTFVCYGL